METEKMFKGSPKYFELTAGEISNEIYHSMNFPTRCGFKCIKCALPGSCGRAVGNLLTTDQNIEILNKVKKIGKRALVIMGLGEPTAGFSLVKPVIKAANDREFITIMFTTLYDLDISQAEFYQDNNVTLFISLDSLDKNMYRSLTGGGDLKHVRRNIDVIRSVYRNTPEKIGDQKIVRMGFNVTLCRQNKDEINLIRDFTTEDEIFVVNPPMKLGRLENLAAWKMLVGDDEGYEELKNLARLHSDTGGQSSLTKKRICGYCDLGTANDIDGQILFPCSYARKSGLWLPNIMDLTSTQFLKLSQKLKVLMHQLIQTFGITSSCPVRDEAFFQTLMKRLKELKL